MSTATANSAATATCCTRCCAAPGCSRAATSSARPSSIDNAVRSHGLEELATDEVQLSDIPLLITAKKNGTAVVCSLHGKSVRDVIDHPHRRDLMGAVQNPFNGSVAQREEAVFGMVIEVHGKGLYRVITDVPAAIIDHYARHPLEYRYFGPWTGEMKAAKLTRSSRPHTSGHTAQAAQTPGDQRWDRGSVRCSHAQGDDRNGDGRPGEEWPTPQGHHRPPVSRAASISRANYSSPSLTTPRARNPTPESWAVSCLLTGSRSVEGTVHGGASGEAT